MRFHSTLESVKNREMTVLAILETVAAVSLSIWLATRSGSLFYIVVATLLAPFLLLRTGESTKLGLRLFAPICGRSVDIFKSLEADYGE